jgi:hypothetical protein
MRPMEAYLATLHFVIASDRRERSNPQGAQRGQADALEGRWGLLQAQKARLRNDRDETVGWLGSIPYEGQSVLYHVHYAIKGPEARNVELIKAEASGSREPKER